ncbi:YeiH family protein [Acidisoma cellulosilyticum]|nr:putative sulfate exporter family transporter [Acidisoma cellulosilyticum]
MKRPLAEKSWPIILPPLSGAVLPGVALSCGVTVIAFGLQFLEAGQLGKVWLEALVLAILLGTIIRTIWKPSKYWQVGVRFSGKYFLEVAVVCLGLSVSAKTIFAAGPALLVGIAGVVAFAILLSLGIGRLLRLPPRIALLIACGNSICGNSAIAAVASVIGAEGDDVAASIAFTAVFGIIVVVGLPFLGPVLNMHGALYGAFAGLTVYAVPQVIAAAAPLGATAVQMGTLVKLVRVLMLGPVCLVISLTMARAVAEQGLGQDSLGMAATARKRPKLTQLVPWFIWGFVALIVLRSASLVPHALIKPAETTATLLTVVSMAALGLGVDIRAVAQSGARVTATVILSLAALGVVSLALLSCLHLGQ